MRGIATRRDFRFAEEAEPHRPMLEHIVEELRNGGRPATPAAALRTSAIMNNALDDYYGGRDDDVLGATEPLEEPAQPCGSQRIARRARLTD